jgi:predicted nuclease with TOPRIM domain
LQVERLSDSVFYEEVADRIYNLRSFLGQTEEEYYASHSEVKDIEDSYSDILSELEVKGEWTKWTKWTTKRGDKTGRQNETTKQYHISFRLSFLCFLFFFGSLFSERNSTI